MGHPFELIVLGPMAWRTSIGHPFRSKGEVIWGSLRKFGLAILSSRFGGFSCRCNIPYIDCS